MHSRRELPANRLSPCTPPLASCLARQQTLRQTGWDLKSGFSGFHSHESTNKYIHNIYIYLYPPIYIYIFMYNGIIEYYTLEKQNSSIMWQRLPKSFELISTAFRGTSILITIDQHTSQVGWNMFGINQPTWDKCWSMVISINCNCYMIFLSFFRVASPTA